ARARITPMEGAPTPPFVRWSPPRPSLGHPSQLGDVPSPGRDHTGGSIAVSTSPVEVGELTIRATGIGRPAANRGTDIDHTPGGRHEPGPVHRHRAPPHALAHRAVATSEALASRLGAGGGGP